MAGHTPDALLDRMAASAVADPPPLPEHVRERLTALLADRVRRRTTPTRQPARRKAA